MVGVTIVGEVANTLEPVPVTAVTEVPFILNEFPVPAVSKVLLVSVSVVAFPTKVSVAAGRVSVPEAVAEACSVVVPLVEPDNSGADRVGPVPKTFYPSLSHR